MEEGRKERNERGNAKEKVKFIQGKDIIQREILALKIFFNLKKLEKKSSKSLQKSQSERKSPVLNLNNLWRLFTHKLSRTKVPPTSPC